MCKGHREEDESRIQILGGLRDMTIQTELCREDKNSRDQEKNIEEILRIMRASGATE